MPRSGSSSSFVVQDTLRSVLKLSGARDFRGLVTSCLFMSVYTPQHLLVRILEALKHRAFEASQFLLLYKLPFGKLVLLAHTPNIPFSTRQAGSLHVSDAFIRCPSFGS